ncbi:hypothetical protein H1C71_015925, partial [Ictidomys tridecemlineatus]
GDAEREGHGLPGRTGSAGPPVRRRTVPELRATLHSRPHAALTQGILPPPQRLHITSQRASCKIRDFGAFPEVPKPGAKLDLRFAGSSPRCSPAFSQNICTRSHADQGRGARRSPGLRGAPRGRLV